MNHFIDYFQSIPDPRIDRTKLHLLEDIIGLAVIAVICGAESWEAIEEFGQMKENFLRTILSLPNGIASHDTIERVFKRIQPEKFEECFILWTNALFKKTGGEIINIDGKTLRGSQDKKNGKSAIHMVSAWANTNRLVLGQIKTEEKSNEITAIPKLLEVLDVEGSIITIDAMGCQKEIAKKIKDKNADYIFGLKGNQGYLKEQVEGLFTQRKPDDVSEQTEKDHGRIETRKCFVINNLDWLETKADWVGLQSVVKIEAHREINDKVTKEIRYYISSLNKDAAFMQTGIRNHWGIENSQHWVLDMAFREDENRKRKDNAAENFAIVRRIALNMLKKDNSTRMGIQNRRLMAAWSNEYLLKILKI